MNPFDDKHCTGCRACEQICPVHCIAMKSDQDGFITPHRDTDRCITCGLCEQYCPSKYKTAEGRHPPNVYAVWLKDSEKLAGSSSGGAFLALANYILAQDGVVFGCAFDDKIQAIQMGVQNAAELELLRGSKYVQSDTRDTFSQVKYYLEKGKKVLYSGTPCQVAGLKAFLHQDYTGLITADLICHGVPSPLFFKKYLEWLSLKLHGEVLSINFRDKSKYGWGHWGSVMFLKRKRTFSKRIAPQQDPYYSLFLAGEISRYCCYECSYASPNRVGDFTIGDFWGIKRFYPDMDMHRGVSLMMVNSDKAKQILPVISESLDVMEGTFEQAVLENHQLARPLAIKDQREALLRAARDDNFTGVTRLWHKYHRREILRARICSLFPRHFQNYIKKKLKRFGLLAFVERHLLKPAKI